MDHIPPRCTRALRLARIEELKVAIASGTAPLEAARVCGRRWGLSGRRSRSRYLAAALASWRIEAKLDRRGSLAVALATRRELYRRALAAGDHGAAERTLRGLEDLFGLHEREQPVDAAAALMPTVVRLLEVVRAEVGESAALARIAVRAAKELEDARVREPVNRRVFED